MTVLTSYQQRWRYTSCGAPAVEHNLPDLGICDNRHLIMDQMPWLCVEPREAIGWSHAADTYIARRLLPSLQDVCFILGQYARSKCLRRANRARYEKQGGQRF